MTPTDEQRAISQSASRAGSLLINAYAGCGKTTTLAMAAAQIKVPGLAVAFNKSIAKELGKRFPGNFAVNTLNGLGFAAWARSRPTVGTWKIDDRKLGRLVSELAKEQKTELTVAQWEQVRGAVAAAQLRGLSPGDRGQPLTPDTPEAWQVIGQELWIDDADAERLLDLARLTLARSNEAALRGLISFDDQIYCPIVLGGQWPKFPVLVVDEAQDLSELQHRMLTLASRPDAKWIICGDRKQAIYHWRGASGRSMEGLRQVHGAGAWTELPLATTFRCPKVIVERQQAHAPGFRAAERAPNGKVRDLRGQDREAMCWKTWTWKDLALQAPSTSLAILCRNNAPLLSLAFKLIRGRVGIKFLGREIGKGLAELSRKLAREDGAGIEILLGHLAEWEEREAAKAMANGQDERLESIYDRVECLRAVAASAEVHTAGQLRAALKELFEQDGLVTLATIHRAKGLEWDCVVHLDPWRIPSKKAQANGGLELEQEWNLRYVCETRTRDTLVLASLDDFVSETGE